MATALPQVCVVGAGTMGRGIAQVALTAGHHVSMVDPHKVQLTSATEDIAARLARKHPALAGDLETRLKTFTSMPEVPADPDTLVIEAVLESLEVKAEVFGAAADHFGDRCILATNTSSLSVTEIAARSPLPDRVVGMHFFNPVPVMRLVEVVTGLQTDPAVADLVADLAVAWGKDVARVKSAPGFIVNRVARAFYGEALRLVEEQVATPNTIDAIMRGAGGFRMGPFELMDLIGNDVNAAVTRSVWTAYNFDPRFQPSRIQDELVAAGRYGRKSGQGFYSYEEGTKPQPTRAAPVAAAAAATVKTVGRCAQLEAIFERSNVLIRQVEHRPGAAPGERFGEESGRRPSGYAVLPNGIVVLVTRGQTARTEAAAFEGAPVVVIDRCLAPSSATTVALSSSTPAALDPVIALLAQASITAMPVTDAPGLVLARTLALIANEAWETALHGIATPADIDTAMKLGTNYPSGPFEWTDRWGARAVTDLLDELWATYHDARYRTSRALRDEAAST